MDEGIYTITLYKYLSVVGLEKFIKEKTQEVSAMLIGCCSNLVAQGDDKVGIGRFEAIKAAGFDYVELPIANVMDLDDEAFEALCSKLEELDLKCLRCCNLFPASVRVTGEEADYTKVREYLDKAVARMRKLGAKVVAMSDSNGYIYDAEGIDLSIVKQIFILHRAKHGVTSRLNEGSTFWFELKK